MKNITLVGRLTKDAEEVTSVEWPFLKFSIAVDDGYGEKKQTLYFDCNYSRIKMLDYLRKGTQVCIAGDFSAREYESKIYFNVYVNSLTLLARPKNMISENPVKYTDHDERNDTTNHTTTNASAGSEIDDEIPF